MANNLYRCVRFTCSFLQKTIVYVDFFIRTTHWNMHFRTVLDAFTSLVSFIANHAMRVRWSEALFVTGDGYWNLRHNYFKRDIDLNVRDCPRVGTINTVAQVSETCLKPVISWWVEVKNAIAGAIQRGLEACQGSCYVFERNDMLLNWWARLRVSITQVNDSRNFREF